VSAEGNNPLRKYYHVAEKLTFEELGDGTVRVSSEEGKSGIFHWDGRFVSGDLTTVNQHMLAYVGGPSVPKAFNYRWTELLPVIDRESGWREDHEKYLVENGILNR
jgi:hypothetical protein